MISRGLLLNKPRLRNVRQSNVRLVGAPIGWVCRCASLCNHVGQVLLPDRSDFVSLVSALQRVVHLAIVELVVSARLATIRTPCSGAT